MTEHEAPSGRANHAPVKAREDLIALCGALEDWPVHRPAAPEAPIPGRHWSAGCEPFDWNEEHGYHGPGPRVDPATGVCSGCGDRACPRCGFEVWDGACGC